MRRSMVQAKDEENSHSRNYLNPQAQSHSVSGPEISNDVNGRSIDYKQQAMQPLNMG